MAAAQHSWGDSETVASEGPAKPFSWSDLIQPATLTGLADSGLVLLFVAGLNVGWLSWRLLQWYALITVGKLVLLGMTWNQRAPLSGPAKWLIGSTATMALATTAAGVSSFGPYVPVGAFLVHLVLTSTLIGGQPLRRYLLAPVLIISSSALFHVSLCLTHRMPSWWGRFLYFGYNQFNLGGEIEAIGCMTAALLLPRLLFFPVVAALLFDMNLMQTRSAMLTGFATILVVLLFDAHRRLTGRRTLALLFIVPIAALLVVGVGVGGQLGDAVSNVLMLNDANRGVASGGSGRADLWEWSLQLFNASPIVGHDLGYFESIGFIGSHNLFLYGLAQYGLMSLLFFGSLIYAYVVLSRSDLFRFAVMLCALPLLLFNDRFTNLNPYPFIFFILLTTATIRRPGDRAVTDPSVPLGR